ncbi:unnamed protein product [Caenorhabditis bovis]|uniref:Protein-serine O-palmitoleoyltransferase porcupine n=1 Tax=Caenorhabditis bovis TaxID=2654633 RepID=A0A8S1EH34_9PELO|nr:unnamed protein product [Caenorhabditis bovis]
MEDLGPAELEDLLAYRDYLEQYYVNGIEEQCLSQIVLGAFNSLKPILLATVGTKIVMKMKLPKWLTVLLHMMLCLCQLSTFTKGAIVWYFLVNLMSFIPMYLISIRKLGGTKALVFSLAFILIAQFWLSPAEFMSVRGVLMLQAMKVITVAYEEQDLRRRNTVFENLDYLFFPPTLLFGPYMTLEDFKKMKNKVESTKLREYLTYLFALIIIFIGSFALVFSTCFADEIPIYYGIVDSWLVALSFRASHYFVSAVAQGIAIFFGIDVISTNILKIEFPRSIASLVIAWSPPMHKFLHTYVFKKSPFRQPFRKIMYTFLISSLLHGVDTQIAFTLFALGFIGYCESELRRKIAQRYSMCVKSKECDDKCKHRHKYDDLLVLLINAFFGVLTMYHLVFTGMSFVDEYAQIGYPFLHIIYTWRDHYYASFIISIISFAISRYI